MSKRPTKLLSVLVFLFFNTLIYGQTTFRGVVLDAKNKAPIIEAKIGIIGQGVGEITNDKGYFVYSKYHEVLDEDSILEISAQGYKPIIKKGSEIRQLFGTPSTIYLEKDRKFKNKTSTAFEDIVLYWDNSASSEKRNFNTEWQTVSHFIQRKEVKNIKLVVFNTGVIWEEEINLSKTSLIMLRDKLGAIKSEGLSNYDVIDSFDASAILLVSDGNPIFGEGHFSSNVPVYIVASGSGKNEYFNKLSKFTGGKILTVLEKNQLEKESLIAATSTNLNTNSSNITANKLITYESVIKGSVSSVFGPIQGASISIKGNLEEYYTEVDGVFSIVADETDILKFSYLGMHPKTLTGREVLKNGNIELIPKADVLDEVTLKGKNDRGSEKIDIGFGEVSKDALGIAVNHISSEDIKPSAQFVTDILRGQFAGILVVRNGLLAGQEKVLLRGGTPALWVVDGVIVSPTNPSDPNAGVPPDFLDAQNIESMTIIKSPAGTVAYGGVPAILVKTKTATRFERRKESAYNSALIKDNEYTEELSSIDDGLIAANQRKMLKGKVYNPAGPIQGASILRRGSFDEYFSKADGSFAIPATAGDILNFSYLGMHSKGIVIEDELQFLDIPMEPIAELLDEVVLKGKEREDEKILTAYGKESRDKIGYAINYLTSEEIKPSVQYVSDILRGRFAGVTVTGFGPTANLRLRPGLGTPRSPIPSSGGVGDPSSGNRFAWVIDNSIILATLGEINLFVDPHNIESLTVLKSSIATNRYGTIAVGGAIVIKTKTLVPLESLNAATNPKSALVKGNTYEENLKTIDIAANAPSYIKELMQLQTLSERYERYEEMASAQDPSVAFYVDMAQYFQQYDITRVGQILDKLATLGRSNVKVLRVLAYLYEAGKDYEKARLTYERILKLAPHETQSYRDLALVYQEVGEYNKSLELYINMLGEQIMGLDFSGLEKPLKSELNHLVARHKDKIAFDRLPNEWLRVGYKIDLRMVIEWSDRSAPFEFQFVNPERKFFEWSHTLDQNKERLFQEQDQGFQTEEFIIDDAPQGDWLVNIQYLGEADEFTLPPYLKYTIYRNYGTPQETKEIKVIKLYLQEEKVTLSKINA